MKKNYSIKIFNLLCRRVYKLSKKRKLGWTWNDCQRWTSANLFKQYKGKPISKIKLTEVDNNVISVLDNVTIKMPKTTAPEVCSSVFLIPEVDLQPLDYWWEIDNDRFSTFNNDLKIRIVVLGVVDTGILKKSDIDFNSIREKFRTTYKNSYAEHQPLYVFKRMYLSGKNNSTNPCDTYLLLTEEYSDVDIESENDEAKSETKVKVSDLPKEVQKQREELKIKAKKTKAEIKKTELPKKVEGKAKKVEQKPKKVEVAPKKVEGKTKEVIKLETQRYAELNKTLERLENQYKSGLLTKKEWLKRQDIILNKFESGGIA
jgi:hypothetical protein